MQRVIKAVLPDNVQVTKEAKVCLALLDCFLISVCVVVCVSLFFVEGIERDCGD